MIEHQIRDVPDSVCKKCPQLWEGECRTFCVPHSEEERMQRTVARNWSARLPCVMWQRAGAQRSKPPALDKFDFWTIVVLVLALLTVAALILIGMS